MEKGGDHDLKGHDPDEDIELNTGFVELAHAIVSPSGSNIISQLGEIVPKRAS